MDCRQAARALENVEVSEKDEDEEVTNKKNDRNYKINDHPMPGIHRV